jgi:hypothetical protein
MQFTWFLKLRKHFFKTINLEKKKGKSQIIKIIKLKIKIIIKNIQNGL